MPALKTARSMWNIPSKRRLPVILLVTASRGDKKANRAPLSVLRLYGWLHQHSPPPPPEKRKQAKRSPSAWTRKHSDILTLFFWCYTLLIALLYTVSVPITLLWDYNVNVVRIVTITVSGGVIFSIKWALCVRWCCIFSRPVIGWKAASRLHSHV